MLARLRTLSEFLNMLDARLREDRLLQVAGSLTFTALLALVPLVTIALTVFSAFPAFGEFSAAIRGFIDANLMPNAAGKVVSVYMRQFTDNAGRLTAIGMAFLAVTAVMMMLTIDRTFNTIWRVPRPRPLIARILTYWGVLTVGPLLIGASLSLTSWLVARSPQMVRDGGFALVRFLPPLLTCLALAFLYRTVPNRRVETGDALLGGALGGLLFEGAKTAFGAYLRQVPTYKLVYGAFASVPVFLLWIYISWLVVLIGAVFTSVLPYLRGGVRLRTAPGDALIDALKLLHALFRAHQAGRVSTLADLRKELRAPWEDCEGLLARLAQAGWVVETSSGGWVLAKDAADIRLADLFREFVFRPDDALDDSSDESWEAAVNRIVLGLQNDLSISLEALFSLPAAKRRAVVT
jgi:membrane protein